jgi:hypothetical protein
MQRKPFETYFYSSKSSRLEARLSFIWLYYLFKGGGGLSVFVVVLVTRSVVHNLQLRMGSWRGKQATVLERA